VQVVAHYSALSSFLCPLVRPALSIYLLSLSPKNCCTAAPTCASIPNGNIRKPRGTGRLGDAASGRLRQRQQRRDLQGQDAHTHDTRRHSRQRRTTPGATRGNGATADANVRIQRVLAQRATRMWWWRPMRAARVRATSGSSGRKCH
ncbi:unnamed protein product, partial [Amoebophrya sp. A120]